MSIVSLEVQTPPSKNPSIPFKAASSCSPVKVLHPFWQSLIPCHISILTHLLQTLGGANWVFWQKNLMGKLIKLATSSLYKNKDSFWASSPLKLRTSEKLVGKSKMSSRGYFAVLRELNFTHKNKPWSFFLRGAVHQIRRK